MKKELLKLIFKEENISIGRKLHTCSEQIAGVNSPILCRLYKTKKGTINFEFSVEKFNNGQLIEYFQPVGFYTFEEDGEIDVQIHILNEFIEDIDMAELHAELFFRKNILFTPLSILENMMIGAVSMNAHIKAITEKEGSFTANGYGYQLLWTYDKEYMQAFFSDNLIEALNMKRPITAYLSMNNNGRNAIVPMSEFQALYNELMNKELLTAYRQF